MTNPSYSDLVAQLVEIAHLNSALSLLHWDRDVLMKHELGVQTETLARSGKMFGRANQVPAVH